MKKIYVIGVAGLLMLSLSGCSGSRTSAPEETEQATVLPLSGRCDSVVSKMSRAITHMGGAGSKYTTQEVLDVVSENADKLDGILSVYEFTLSERALIRGVTDGLYEIKMALSTGEGDITNAIEVVNSGWTEITTICAE